MIGGNLADHSQRAWVRLPFNNNPRVREFMSNNLTTMQARLRDDLRGVVSGEVYCDEATLQLYSTDGSMFQCRPLVVVYPRSAEDVAAVMKYAAEMNLTVHSRGSGTGTVGGALGKGIILDFSRFMRHVIQVDDETVTAGPGVIRERLNDIIRKTKNKFFAPSTGHFPTCTLGSILAVDCVGPRWLTHAFPHDYIRELEVVTGDGRIRTLRPEKIVLQKDGTIRFPENSLYQEDEIWTKLIHLLFRASDEINSEQKKDFPECAGYRLESVLRFEEKIPVWPNYERKAVFDPTRLIVGSEGSLGVITKAVLTTFPAPKYSGSVVLLFDSMDKAARSIATILQFHPTLCDMLDRRIINMVREWDRRFVSVLPSEAEIVLVVEFNTETAELLNDCMNRLIQNLRDQQKLIFGSWFAFHKDEKDMFRDLLRKAQGALLRIRPPFQAVSLLEDICVPVAVLPECLHKIQSMLSAAGVTHSLSGHVGQGQIRIQPLFDLTADDFVQPVLRLADKIYDLVFSFGGSIASASGTGLTRSFLLPKRYPRLFPFFVEIKKLFDPDFRLNPGCVVSAETLEEADALVPSEKSNGDAAEDEKAFENSVQDNAAHKNSAGFKKTGSKSGEEKNAEKSRYETGNENVAEKNADASGKETDPQSGAKNDELTASDSHLSIKLWTAADTEKILTACGLSSNGSYGPKTEISAEINRGQSGLLPMRSDHDAEVVFGKESEKAAGEDCNKSRLEEVRQESFEKRDSEKKFSENEEISKRNPWCGKLRSFALTKREDGPGASKKDLSASRRQLEFQLKWDPRKIELETFQCTGCGLCRIRTQETRMCPNFRLTPDEFAAPRAKANILRGILENSLPLEALTEEDVQRIGQECLFCHCCVNECPAQVNVPKLAFQIKSAWNAAHGINMSDWFFSNTDSILAFFSHFATMTNAAMTKPSFRWVLDKMFGLRQTRKLPRITRSFLSQISKKKYQIKANIRRQNKKIALFLDNYANYIDPALTEAAIKILEHNNINVYIPERQQSSGYAAIMAGNSYRAEVIVQRNTTVFVDLIRQGCEAVTIEPISAVCIRQEYPFVRDDEETALFGAHTTDLCSYLYQLHRDGELQLDFNPVPETIGYHAPCRTLALTGDSVASPTPAEELLHLIPGLNVRRLERGCCGSSGISGLKKENISRGVRLGRRLFLALRDPSFSAGCSECNFCKMQMEQGADKPTIHPLKFLAYAYGLIDDPMMKK